MRLSLFLFCVWGLLSAAAQQNAPGNYLGEWNGVIGAQEPKSTFQISLSRDSITMRYDSLTYTKAYTLECTADSCMLTMQGEKTPQSRYVLLPIDGNAFYFNTLENHTQYLAAKQAKPGATAWGWTNPRPIRFERQQEKP